MLNYNLIDIIKDIHRDFGIHITYFKVFRVKEHVLSIINESYEDIYKILPEYCQKIIESNPGTMIILDIDNDQQIPSFISLFWSQHARIHSLSLNIIYNIIIIVSKKNIPREHV